MSDAQNSDDRLVESEAVESDVVESDVVESEAVEVVDDPADEPDQDAVVPPATPTGWRRSRLTLFTAAALVVSAVLAGSVYWFVFRPDQLTDQQAREEVLDAAKDGTVAVLTYSPETVDKDLAGAKAQLTGDFLKQYTDFTEQTVVPAAKNAGVKTEATVTRAAISQMKPGSAQVLVFVNQVTTSRTRPTPALATSSVIVTLVRQGGHWLISDFKPV